MTIQNKMKIPLIETNPSVNKCRTPPFPDNFDIKSSLKNELPTNFYKFWDQQFVKNGFVPQALIDSKDVSTILISKILRLF